MKFTPEQKAKFEEFAERLRDVPRDGPYFRVDYDANGNIGKEVTMDGRFTLDELRELVSLLPVDLAQTRMEFEKAFKSLFARIRATGCRMENDNGGDDLFWRTVGQRYGVHAVENAWQGWLLAKGIEAVVVVAE